MKEVGTFMGVKLLLDTDDEKIGELADKYFEQLWKDMEDYRSLKTELEIKSWYK